MEQEKEDIMKELIFEATTRDMLVGKTASIVQISDQGDASRSAVSGGKTKNMWLLVKAAAIAIVVIGAIFVMRNQLQDNSSRDQYAVSIHTVPMVTKSRGAAPAMIDQYIDLLEEEKYQEVLVKLNQATTEKDTWIKAHLLFSLGKYKDVITHIEGHSWKDELYVSDMEWLQALIDYKKGAAIEEIIGQYSNLTPEQVTDLEAGF